MSAGVSTASSGRHCGHGTTPGSARLLADQLRREGAPVSFATGRVSADASLDRHSNLEFLAFLKPTPLGLR